ncbi:MAG TPA: ABC transporter permease [Candidatus Limnocylindrales bacterium]|nr:ABC transporter permease [Candidatus Limnocylindrales bacterium]
MTLSMPAAAGMLLFFVAPIALFLVYSFLTAGLYSVSAPLTIDSYREAVDSEFNRALARNSFLIGVTAALVTVAFAIPVAYWLRYSAGRWRMPVLFLITASMFASYLVRIYAWRSILGSNGLLNSGLERLGLVDEPLGFLLYNRFAVTVALVHIFLPYVVLVVYAGFAPIPSGLLEAARDLGAGALQRWRRVILPLIAAPAASSFLFVFVLSAADYVTPQFLGGANGLMLGVQIQTSFVSTGNWPLGAALSFLMLAAFVGCYAAVALALRLLKLDRIVVAH